MMLATKLQNKLMEIYDEKIFEDSKFSKVQAVSAAFASGVIDGAVIMYPYLLICMMLIAHEAKKLNK